ncbi:MAG: hypothetical protein RL477_1143, partial [Pseudomonadota bacterium]
MHRKFLAVSAAMFLAACAPQTVIANKQQAVVEAWSHQDAVGTAKRECARFDRWPLLQRQTGSEYWFACLESDEAVFRREKASQAEA